MSIACNFYNGFRKYLESWIIHFYVYIIRIFFSINGNANSRNPWPELCQKNEVKHSSRKKDFINITDDNRAASLDHSEYPELGSALVKSKNFVVPRDHCLSRPNSVQIVLPMQTSMESKRSKSLKRYKKSDKICINLQEALQVTVINIMIKWLFYNDKR